MWVKICGITDERIAEEVAALGPDAIGLNFYSNSRRCVTLESARRIVANLPASIEPVGVFVNHSADEITRICDECGIGTIQLHGDEPLEFAAKLARWEIIRAFRVGEQSLNGPAVELDAYRRLGVRLRACLVEARVAGSYGGTGQLAPWPQLAQHWDRNQWPPLILAGGLTPENVAAGIAAVHPWGVDVAGGVEHSPGQQDIEKVRRFIHAARKERAGS